MANGATSLRMLVTVSEGTPAAVSESPRCPATKLKCAMVIPPALVDLFHRCAGVGLGSAEGCHKELGLFVFEAVHIRSGEEAAELIVGEHTYIEVFDDGFDRLIPADLVVDADRRTFTKA